LLCWQNNNRLVAGLTLLKTSKMMTVADPQEAFEGLIKGSSKTRISLQPANEGERRAGDGQSTTDDAADGCDDRTAGLGWSGVLQDLLDCGFAEGAGDAGESVAGDQIAGALYCGLKLRSGIGKH